MYFAILFGKIKGESASMMALSRPKWGIVLRNIRPPFPPRPTLPAVTFK